MYVLDINDNLYGIGVTKGIRHRPIAGRRVCISGPPAFNSNGGVIQRRCSMIDKFLDTEMRLSEMERDTGKALKEIAPHVSDETAKNLRELHRLSKLTRQQVARDF